MNRHLILFLFLILLLPQVHGCTRKSEDPQASSVPTTVAPRSETSPTPCATPLPGVPTECKVE